MQVVFACNLKKTMIQCARIYAFISFGKENLLMKKILSVLLACIMLVACVSVFAEDSMFVFTPKDITVTYNGDAITFPDAQPIMQNSRTLVPVRAIMERANLTVDYNGDTKTVTATRDDLTITMTLDNTTATITSGDGTQTVTLDVPPTMIDNRTYVPIRFISECIDVKVNWNGLYNEVVLIDTGEWKQEIAENAKLLNCLLDMPLADDVARVGNVSGNLQLGYILKNLPVQTGLASKMTACLDFYLTGTQMYDGKYFASYAVVDADLSALKTLYAGSGNLNAAPSDDVATKHKIELDIIMDDQWNLYVKSTGLLELINGTDDAITKAASNKYIKMSLCDVLGTTLPAMSDCKTHWDFFAAGINADDMLYTQSVALLDDMIDTWVKKYHNDSLRITERYDGTYFWSLTVDQEDVADFTVTMSRLSGINAGDPMNEEALKTKKATYDDDKIKQTITVLMDDNTPTKIEVTYASQTDPAAIAGTNTESSAKVPTIESAHKANFGASTRKFNSYKDKKIVIPTNVITLEELEQLK